MWSDIAVPLLRNKINDTVETYTYTDSRLIGVLLTQAYNFTANNDLGYTVDIVGSGITPDPSDDVNFINLIVLKAGCLIAESEWKTEARRGILVRDGPTTYDNKNAIQVRKEYYEQIKRELELTELRYQMKNIPVHGIMGPFEV